MRGKISTQAEDISLFQPTISPVVLRKLRKYEPEKSLLTNVEIVSDDASDYAFAKEQLALTEEKIVRPRFENLTGTV